MVRFGFSAWVSWLFWRVGFFLPAAKGWGSVLEMCSGD